MTAAPRDSGPPAPLSARGVALLDAGRADEAVEVLLHALAAGEPGADDLLARAYLDGRDWFAAADHLRRLLPAGPCSSPGGSAWRSPRSGRSTGRRRRSGSPWTRASWRRRTTSRSCST